MASNHPFRQRPAPFYDPQGPPFPPRMIRFLHPANNLPFLHLPAYDRCPTPEMQFGVHHETALTACQILACNSPGYLSSSRDRNAQGVDATPDSILAPRRYYYHLNTPEVDELYPICRLFEYWEFPHDTFPSSWETEDSNTPTFWGTHWTTLSQRIKDRDKACLLSGWKDSLTTAHVVPSADEVWLNKNQMYIYLDGRSPLHHDPRNLFTLRWDLHVGQFDPAQFVIVPKSQNLVVHFVDISQESAQCYHNVIFDHNHTLSHELLYTHFAWAIIQIARNVHAGMKEFNFSDTSESKKLGTRSDESRNPGRGGAGGSGGGGSAGGSRGAGAGGGGGGGTGKRKRGSTSEDKDNGASDDGDKSATYHPGGSTSRQQMRPDDLALQSNAWLSDVLYKMAPGITPTSLESEAQEIEEDLKTAASTLPFFVDPTLKASPHKYNEVLWYPGRNVVEKRKQAYLDQHPHIRAHSDLLLPDSYDASDDETF